MPSKKILAVMKTLQLDDNTTTTYRTFGKTYPNI